MVGAVNVMNVRRTGQSAEARHQAIKQQVRQEAKGSAEKQSTNGPEHADVGDPNWWQWQICSTGTAASIVLTGHTQN